MTHARAHYGDVQLTLAPKSERDRTSHAIALELRQKLNELLLTARR